MAPQSHLCSQAPMELRYRVLESPLFKPVDKVSQTTPTIQISIYISRSWVSIRTGRQKSLDWRITPPLQSGQAGKDGSNRTGVFVAGTGCVEC